MALTDQALDVEAVYRWCVDPGCGAVVLFSGTVRDHSVDGETRRDGVSSLTYEAYESRALEVLAAIDAEARVRWPAIAKVAMVHRTGEVPLSESSVVVAVSTPHRPEAFAAGSWLIDAVKASAPIWKREQWDGGAAWGTGATPPVPAHEVGRSC